MYSFTKVAHPKVAFSIRQFDPGLAIPWVIKYLGAMALLERHELQMGVGIPT